MCAFYQGEAGHINKPYSPPFKPVSTITVGSAMEASCDQACFSSGSQVWGSADLYITCIGFRIGLKDAYELIC